MQYKNHEKSKMLNKLIRKSNKNEDYSTLNNMLSENLNIIKNSNTICSFDMEFSDIEGENVVEIGFAIFDREKNESLFEHFIIKEFKDKYERKNTPIEHSLMFSYGKSKVVSLDEAMLSLNNAMKNSDVNIVFAEENKYKHMLKHNFSNSSYICIQELIKMKEHSVFRRPLSEEVSILSPQEQPINNAGNDAVSALQIISSYFGNRIDFENYSPKIETNYSQDERKKKALSILCSRRRSQKNYFY